MNLRLFLIGLLLLTGLNIFLAFNYHSHSERHSYHGELWADRGGYFVYLPYCFSYGGDVSNMPVGLDSLTGNGFSIDPGRRRIVTKYTAGVAMLQAPAYLVAHGVGNVLGLDTSPYGDVDHALINVLAPVYVGSGFLLLFLWLRKERNARIVAWTLFAAYTGSNLYYYTIGDPGMSHAYSFFLFSALLFLLDKAYQASAMERLALIGLAAGWIVLIRPTNVVFVLVAPLAVTPDLKTAKRWLVHLLSVRGNWFAVLVPAILVWVPQILYWRHAFGSAITWPYGDEGFSNWMRPELVAFWFAPNNGLFTYTPLYGLVILACVMVWRLRRAGSALASLLAFGLVSYWGSSWWVWHFGCGFGSRTMVEYMALFMLPLVMWTEHLNHRSGRWVPLILFAVCTAYNLKLVYSYGSCWFHDAWDWQVFGRLLFGPTK